MRRGGEEGVRHADAGKTLWERPPTLVPLPGSTAFELLNGRNVGI